MNQLKLVSFILASIFIIVLSLPACAIQPNTEMTGSWFRSKDYTGIMTRIPFEADYMFYADEPLENCIYVSPGLEPYCYEGEIDWTIGDKTRTWYLYFQSLQVVGFLANAAELTGEPVYLEKAAEIIESWYDFHLNNHSPPPLAWDEAAVGFRVRNIMHFLRAYQALPELNLPDPLFVKIHTLLNKHADFLFKDNNYRPNNHGLMASMALTQIALTFPEFHNSGKWKETGLKRIRERIDADLSAESVHMEHSAFYHVYFLNLVLQVDGYLQSKGISLFDAGDSTIADMENYLAYMVMPNHHLPQIGDTSDFELRTNYNNSWIQYSLSDGLEGTRPPANSVVYPDAGVAILRDGWNPGSAFLSTTYLFFQSAFHSRSHKHADDLGFVLYSHGEDILVGPGACQAQSGNGKYRNYVLSTKSHNTLTVDGSNYPVNDDNVGKASITNYYLGEDFDFVQGSHTIYDGITLKRGIVFIRPSTILVIDESISDIDHSVQQIWNLAPAAHDLKFDKEGASCKVGDKGVEVEIRQLGNVTDVRHYRGQEDPVRGFISPEQKQDSMIPIDQLEFEQYGKKVIFVTQISVASPDETMPDIKIDSSNPYRRIEVDPGSSAPFIIELPQFTSASGAEL